MKGCLKYIAILGIGILIGCIAMGRCNGNGFVCGADDWVSPTSYSDPGSVWTDETKTYDNNTGTYGYTDTDAAYVELNVGAIDCNKVRIYASIDLFGSEYNPWVYVDVYYSAGWHNIKNGSITKKTWIELNIGSVQTVTKARIASSLGYLEYFRLYEFQFNHYVPPPPVPTSLVLLPAGDSNYVNDYHSLNATVYDQYSDTMEGVSIIWSIESGPGWFESYDGETDDSGIAYAVISSNETGETIVKCSVDGYPAVYDTAMKSWQLPPVYTLVLDPVVDTNYVGMNHTISAMFYVDGELGNAYLNWQINDVGWFRSYDEETNGDSGIGYAVISSNVSGITTICCEAVGYEGINDCVTAYWLCPGQGGLTIEDVEEWAISQNFTTLTELQAWLGTLNYTTLEYIAGWLESQNYTTATDITDWAELNGVVMGGAGMPLWYLFGLIALAVGAWWAKSLIVNIMLAAMAGAGFPLIDSTLGGASAGAVYYGVMLVLVLAVIYSLVSIFTRVEHI